MGTRLVNLVADAADPAASARWWAEALGWPVTLELPDEVVVEPPAPGAWASRWCSSRSPTPDRPHDWPPAAQAALVERLLDLGARADVGRGTSRAVAARERVVCWSRDVAGTGRLAAVVVAPPIPAWPVACWPWLPGGDGLSASGAQGGHLEG